MDSLSKASKSDFMSKIDSLDESKVKGWFGPRQVVIGDKSLNFNELITAVGKRRDLTPLEMQKCYAKIKTLEKETRPIHQYIYNRDLAKDKKKLITKYQNENIRSMQKDYINSLPLDQKINLFENGIKKKKMKF